jgi:hypothetical protein
MNIGFTQKNFCILMLRRKDENHEEKSMAFINYIGGDGAGRGCMWRR